MPISFDIQTCERILKKTRLVPRDGGPSKLMDELNRLIPSLVTSLEGKAIPGTSALRGDIRNALAATDRLFWRFGFPRKGASRAMRPSWAPVITKLSDRPGGPDAKQVELRITRLTEDIFWLRDATRRLEHALQR